MTIYSETLTFYTPYSDLNRMIGALKKVLHLEIKNLLHKNNMLEIHLMNNDRIFIKYFTRENKDKAIDEQVQTLYDEINTRNTLPNLRQIKENLLTQIQLVNSIYIVEFEYDEAFRNDRIVSLMDVSDNLTSLILWETGDISNSYGDIILTLEAESEVAIFNPIDEASLYIERYHMNDKQKNRLQRSTQILRYKGIYAPSDLCIPSEGQYYINVDQEDIAKKAISCMIIAIYTNLIADMGWTSDKAFEYVSQMIHMYQANGYFSNDEIDFLNEKNPSKELCERYQMYYEYSYVMLWALGYFPELAFPETASNSSLIVQTIFNYNTVDELVKHSQLQTQDAMLDALDLVQRYAWACRYAIKKQFSMPANLNPLIVGYRHHALKWMISNKEEVWNKVDMKVPTMKRG